MSPAMKATSPGQAVELGDDHRAAAGAAGRKRRGELWPAVEGIGTLAGLGLDDLGCQDEARCLREAFDGSPLGFDAEAETALPGGRDAVVGDGMLHGDKVPAARTNGIPPFAVCT
jgi:hypothetical protein